MAKSEPNLNVNSISRISAGTVIKGEIISPSDIRIDGTFEGKVQTKGRVVVGETAVVKGDIICENIDLWGKVNGNVFVKDTLALMEGEPFDREKILRGMVRASEKRPVAIADIEKAVAEIEQIVQNSLDREVSTDKIGELVMDRLKQLDEVAYVRFASVYRQFKDINSFMRELTKILEEK